MCENPPEVLRPLTRSPFPESVMVMFTFSAMAFLTSEGVPVATMCPLFRTPIVSHTCCASERLCVAQIKRLAPLSARGRSSGTV